MEREAFFVSGGAWGGSREGAKKCVKKGANARAIDRNAAGRNFPDAPLRGLYARSRVYEGVTGLDSFGSWLERLEKRITGGVLGESARQRKLRRNDTRMIMTRPR